MNSCILMAEIVDNPELRHTSDNLAIAQMMVRFLGVKAEDPPMVLKVVGFGNFATEIHERYHKGDRVIIEGRLGMNVITLPGGTKEKHAELTASRIHKLGDDVNFAVPASTANEASSNVVPMRTKAPTAAKDDFEDYTPREREKVKATTTATKSVETETNLDEIPF